MPGKLASGYDGDGLHVQLLDDHRYYWITTPYAASDVAIAVTGAGPGGYGVACRVGEAGWYGAFVRPDGRFSLVRYSPEEGRVPLLPGPEWQDSDAIRPGANRVRLACVGERLTLWINDAQVAAAADGTLSSGGLALLAMSFDEPVEVIFQDFEIEGR